MEKKCVLLVDDDLMTRQLAGFAFKTMSQIEFFAAKDTKEADEILGTIKIDLILMDIFMPGKDGLVYALELKIKPETKDIPIVFLTEAEGEIYHEAAVNLGGIRSFKKSEIMDRDIFQRAVEGFLK